MNELQFLWKNFTLAVYEKTQRYPTLALALDMLTYLVNIVCIVATKCRINNSQSQE